MIPTDAAWRTYGNDPLPYYAVQLSGALPENPVLLALAILVPLAGLYWMAERTFCEMEYRLVGQTSGQGYLQQRA